MKSLAKIPKAVWIGLVLILLIVPLPVASALEERDTFCISCHTAPEETYYARAQQGQAHALPYLDLASAHYGEAEEGFRCIDCHRGNAGLGDRARTLALGAWDALIFLTGQADPVIEKLTTGAPGLVQNSCLECHTDTLLVVGFNNHFHNHLPLAYQAWQAGGQLVAPPEIPNADTSQLVASITEINCLDCHQAHRHLPGSESFFFLDVYGVIYPSCVQCHQDEGKGPQSVEELGG